MTVVEAAYCRQCGHETPQIVDHRDDHMTQTICSVCGSTTRRMLSGSGRQQPKEDRWTRYLARQIGRLRGYDSCQVQEHSIALEIAAREALIGPLPPAVEEQLREALDRVAEAWMARQARAEYGRYESAPTEAPVEAQQAR